MMAKHMTRSRGSTNAVSIPINGDEHGHVPKHKYEGNDWVKDVTFTEDIKSFGYCALRGCSAIEKLDLPKSTRRVGSYAFCNCKGLKSILLNDGLEELEEYALQGCSSLTDIEIPESVKVVGKFALEWCLRLKEVRILGSPEFGKGVFSKCPELERILLMAKDSSQIEHVIPKYMRRVEEAEGDWAIVYERIKEPESPVVVEILDEENQQSSANTAKKTAKTKQRSAASQDSTNDAQQLSRRMFAFRTRMIKLLDKELLPVDKEHKKGLGNCLKLLEEASKERDDLKIKVEGLRKRNKDLATKLQKHKNRDVDDIEMMPRTKDLQDNINDLQERLEQQRKDNTDLRKDKEDMRKDKDDLREQLKALQRENDKLATEREKKDELIETMKTEIGETEAKLQQVTELHDELRPQVVNSNAIMESRNPLETPRRRNNNESQDSDNEGWSTVEKARKNKRRKEDVLSGCIETTAKRLRVLQGESPDN